MPDAVFPAHFEVLDGGQCCDGFVPRRQGNKPEKCLAMRDKALLSGFPKSVIRFCCTALHTIKMCRTQGAPVELSFVSNIGCSVPDDLRWFVFQLRGIDWLSGEAELDI